MTMSAAQAKKTRGNGLVKIMFGDSANKNDHKRVPANVSNIIVADSSGKVSKSYSVEKLSPSLIKQLAAFAIASRIKTYVNNHAENASQASALADEVYGEFVKGQLYTRAEGKGGPGKVYDPTMIVEATRLAIEFNVKKKAVSPKTGKPIEPATQKMLDLYRQKIMAMAPKDRTQFVLAELRKPLINKFYLQIKAQVANKQAESATEAIELPL